MTLPLAIRPRIRLRDEPERTSAAWLPPMALPVAAYWVIMGFLTYEISKAPSWLASERPERGAVDTSADRLVTHVAAARRETPPAGSEVPVVREEPPLVPDRTIAVRSTSEEAPLPAPLPAAPLPRSLEPLPAPSTASPVPHGGEHAREARQSWRANRLTSDSFNIGRSSSPAIYDDPVPEESFAVRKLPTIAPAPNDSSPATVRPVRRSTSKLPSCESALASAADEWDLTAARGAPDLSRDAYAAVLEQGAYFSHCAVPGGTALDICAAVQNGRPVGITVVAHPGNPEVSACVKAAVESLSFPSHPRLDVTRTHFDAVSGR